MRFSAVCDVLMRARADAGGAAICAPANDGRPPRDAVLHHAAEPVHAVPQVAAAMGIRV